MYNTSERFQRLSSAASASYLSQIGCSYWLADINSQLKPNRHSIRTTKNSTFVNLGVTSACWTGYVCCRLSLAGSAEAEAAVLVGLEACR